MTSSHNPKTPDEIPSITRNVQSANLHDSSIYDLPPTYDRQIAHTADIKFINDRYVTPVTIEFVSSYSDNFVNIPVKHHKLFVALKLLDPSLSITINDTIISHSREIPMGVAYTETFQVITDKNPRFPRFFVHR